MIHLEKSMVMCDAYNANTLEKLISTIHQMHNITTPNERLFAGKLGSSFTWYLTKNGVHHYAINTLIFKNIKRKYDRMYVEFIIQLCMYLKVIGILSKGYLPISLISPSKLQEILNAVKEAIQTTNQDCDIVCKRLHLCYDMKLVTFGMDRDR